MRRIAIRDNLHDVAALGEPGGEGGVTRRIEEDPQPRARASLPSSVADQERQAVERRRQHEEVVEQQLAQRAAVRQEFASKEIEVKGINWSPQLSLAVVNDQSVGVGETVEEAQVVGITRDKVTLNYKGEEFEFYNR